MDDGDDTVPAAGEPTFEPRVAVPPAKRYRLGAELGRGGMGRVVEAMDTQLGRTVAYKEVLRDGLGIAERFAREVEITARLEHPAIVPVYDSGVTEDGRPFYVMRKVTGKPLEELIATTTARLALLPAALAAIDAIAHAHRRGVIHRDIKPANILCGDLGETCVIDWGLAKVIGEREQSLPPTSDGGGFADPGSAAEGQRGLIDGVNTQIGSVFGTPGFMAPEQARGEELGPRGDVYALGATLYALLAGKPPHRGKSATEVITNALAKPIDPEELRGSPPDLVAIVIKAMAYEPIDRYPDAAALGDDVRRYLAGQLVGAHSYTRRQRLARFAKRNRSVLAATAIALAIVAVLAWYGIAKILGERDIARAASASALEEKQLADQRYLEIRDRDERRIIAGARALLATNPTGAIATLKQLPASSAHVDEARTVAQAAVARGVAWGLQSPSAMILQAAISPDGTKLFELTSDAVVRMWDLDRHALLWQRTQADARAQVAWLDADHLILHGPTLHPQRVDAATAQMTALPMATMRDVVAAAGVAFYTADDGVHRYDGKTDEMLAIPAGKSLRLAPDASAFAVLDADKRVAIYDGHGGELGHLDGAFYDVAFSTTGRAAAIGAPDVFELTKGAWTKVPLPALPRYTIAQAHYLGDQLAIAVGPRVYFFRENLYERATAGEQPITAFLVAGGLAIAQASEAKLRWATPYETGEIELPMTVTGMKLVGTPDRARVVVLGHGVLLDVSLDGMASQALPKRVDETPLFVGNDAVLYVPSAGDELRWHTLSTGKDVAVTLSAPGAHDVSFVDATGERALVVDMFGAVDAARLDAATTRMWVLDRDQPTGRLVATGIGLWGILLPKQGVVYADVTGRLYAQADREPPHPVNGLDGGVITLVDVGAHGFAAYTDKGQLARGGLDGKLETVYAKKAGRAQLATDARGRIYLGAGNKLFRWDRDLVEVHDFGKPITSLFRIADGVAVGVDGGELLGVTDGAPPARLFAAGTTHVAIGAANRLLIGFHQAQELSLIELPQQLTWSIPATMRGNGHVTISPTAREILYDPEAGTHYSLLRDLRPGPRDLAAWLDELTDATVDASGLVVWPWQ